MCIPAPKMLWLWSAWVLHHFPGAYTLVYQSVWEHRVVRNGEQGGHCESEMMVGTWGCYPHSVIQPGRAWGNLSDEEMWELWRELKVEGWSSLRGTPQGASWRCGQGCGEKKKVQTPQRQRIREFQEGSTKCHIKAGGQRFRRDSWASLITWLQFRSSN